MKHRTTSHSLFLTPQERQKLSKAKSTVETVGFCVPTAQDEAAGLAEIFCRYVVTSDPAAPEISQIEGGYQIAADAKQWVRTARTPEEQVWHQFSVDTVSERQGEKMLTTHMIVIQDVSDLERSTVCEGLADYLNVAQ